MAAGTVAELDRLNADQLAVERRTLKAIGWSAYRVARLAAWEATLLGLAKWPAADRIDVA